MCVVSNVGDYYQQRWPETYPWIQQPNTSPIVVPPEVSKDEFDALKREVQEMKRLIKAAKEIDEVTGQPDCEVEDKVALLRRVAEAFGVSLDDVLVGPVVNPAPTAAEAFSDDRINRV